MGYSSLAKTGSFGQEPAIIKQSLLGATCMTTLRHQTNKEAIQAIPVSFFFFSVGSTFGVWFLTLPE
jgi:hypothetical protein